MLIDKETMVELLIDGLMLGNVQLDQEKVRAIVEKRQKEYADDGEEVTIGYDWDELVDMFKEWARLNKKHSKYEEEKEEYDVRISELYDLFMTVRFKNLLIGEAKNYHIQKENTELKEKIKLLAKKISKQEFKEIMGNVDDDTNLINESPDDNLSHFR